MTNDHDTSEPKSRLGIAALLSIVAIFTTYFVSSFEHQKAQAFNENTSSHQYVVVGAYLA